MDKQIFVRNQKFIFPFLIITSGIIIVLFSPTVSTNIFDNFIYLITNKWFVITTFLALCSIVNEVLEISKNENLILRSGSFSYYIKKNILRIIKLVFIYIILATLLGIIGLILLHVTDFSDKIFDSYSISACFYSIFLFIRFFVLLSFTSIIYYLIGWNHKKTITIFYCVIFIGLLLTNIDIVPLENINKFFPFPIFVTSYLQNSIFSNFSLEISTSIIQIVILMVLFMVLFERYIKKNQRDKIK